MKKRRFVLSKVVEKARVAFFSMAAIKNLQYEAVDGSVIQVGHDTVLFERGDAATVLLVDLQKRRFVLLRNTRIGYAVANIRNHHANCKVTGRFTYQDLARLSGLGLLRGFSLPVDQCQLIEAVAGSTDKMQNPADIVQTEILEEAGYTTPTGARSLGTFIPSPGASTEIVHMFVAYVRGEADRAPQKGALEDGEVVFVPFKKAIHMIMNDEIIDGKTVTMILKFMAMRPKLFR